MLAWLSILAFKASGSRKENLGDKLAKFAPGWILNFTCISSVRRALQVSLKPFQVCFLRRGACKDLPCMEPVLLGKPIAILRPADVI